MVEGYVFYRSFAEALEDVPAEQFKEAVMAISHYALDGIEPDADIDQMSKVIFKLIKPQLDANLKKREAGRRGGEANASRIEAEQKHIEANEKQNEAEVKQVEAKEKEKVKDKVKDKEKEKEKVKDITPEIAVATLDAPGEVKTHLQAFVNMRRAIKKPMTGNAVKLLHKRLMELSTDPEEQCQILEQSIRNSWQDVYALKTEKRTAPKEDYLTQIIRGTA